MSYRYSNSLRLVISIAALVVGTGASSALAAPEISSVRGCSTNGSTTTSDCPTAGGLILLTISGLNFGGAGAHAYVGDTECVVNTATDTDLTCTLPPGSGKNIGVYVSDVSGAASPPAPLLSYSPPEITSVAGCTADPAGNVTECAKIGGTRLTINGENFGPSGSSKVILIGGLECPTAVDGDTSMECTIPPGTGSGKRILVLAANQLSVGQTYTFSYAQCPEGTKANSDGSCTDCPAGTYSNFADNPECFACPSGSDSSAGASGCTGPQKMQCWQAKDVSATKFVKVEDQPISDEIAPSATIDIKKPVLYCTAAETTPSGTPLPEVHQCCYSVKGTKLKPPVAVATDEQGVSRTLELSQPKLICGQCDHL